MTKVSWALLMAFTAGLTFVVPVERSKARIGETADPGLARFILDVGNFDLANRDGSLWWRDR